MRALRGAAILILLLLCLAACRITEEKGEESEEEKMGYLQISQEEAKEIMDSGADVVILDVREQDEYDAGHIPGALLLPYMSVDELAEDMLPDKEKTILVYCRSGRRSKIAAKSLADLGYTDVREFGGILDWPYEVTAPL